MKKAGKIMRWIFIILFTIIVLFICVVLVSRCINANKTKITAKNGIQESMYIKVGGIDQYVQIRGNNKDNPVILWLHGGPGCPLTYLSYHYQTDLEDNYTFVCFEQRGCGRTFYANKNTDNEKELTPELLLNDIDELVNYIKKRFGQDKVIIMGQSWGTVLGSRYAIEHPDKVSAYIGVGQVVDFDRGKIFSAQKAMKLASADDSKKLSALSEKFSICKSIEDLNIKDMEEMIILSSKYLACDGELSGIQHMRLGINSPSMSLNDLRWLLTASNTAVLFKYEKPLIDYMYFGFDAYKQGTTYKVPVYFISGGSDWITPFPMVEEYYKKINAPDKNMIIIKNTGHTPFLDNPQEFCKSVKSILKK